MVDPFFNILNDKLFITKIIGDLKVNVPKAHITNVETNHKYLVLYNKSKNNLKIIDLYSDKYQKEEVSVDDFIKNPKLYIR
jgi:hypothetical protein